MHSVDKECFAGFHLEPGAVSGKDRIEDGLDTDEAGCATLCSKVHENCCSYEHSSKKNICNLNENCEPDDKENEDFKFCVKG